MKHDETIPGGSYVVNGQTVDANGNVLAARAAPEPVEETDNPLDAFPMLAAAGYLTVEQVRAATDEQLRAIDGVGPARLTQIREAVAV